MVSDRSGRQRRWLRLSLTLCVIGLAASICLAVWMSSQERPPTQISGVILANDATVECVVAADPISAPMEGSCEAAIIRVTRSSDPDRVRVGSTRSVTDVQPWEVDSTYTGTVLPGHPEMYIRLVIWGFLTASIVVVGLMSAERKTRRPPQAVPSWYPEAA